ncbi:MAG TPA: hypothetical protein VND42_04030 [Candidatus Acidoferrales bacterium]|nr:hypothetical protein [Candidatus Acidoferrales bacterium]
MRNILFLCAVAVLFAACSAQGVFAQTGSAGAPINAQAMQSTSVKMKFKTMNKLSAATNAMLQTDGDSNGNGGGNNAGTKTIPHWHGAFIYQGIVYPYIMAGHNPRRGDATSIGTQVIPINMVLDGCVDASGNPVAFNIDHATLKNTFNSPEFESASFSTGYTQYTDAVQRAEFHSVMKDDWHTLLNTPQILEPVTMEVPPEDSACVYFPPTGQPFADVNIDYFAGQLETILELEDVDPKQLPIVLTKDVVLFEGTNIFNCCVIGFHSAGPVLGVVGNPAQTFAWASWLSPADNFGGGFEDILPLSHEIGEWANDPFTNNIVPPWQEPDGSGSCGGNLLEVGDPVEIFPNPAFPVVVDGYQYHPQTLALLEWFTRETPSSAIDGAYSYANESLLPSPSIACAP